MPTKTAPKKSKREEKEASTNHVAPSGESASAKVEAARQAWLDAKKENRNELRSEKRAETLEALNPLAETLAEAAAAYVSENMDGREIKYLTLYVKRGNDPKIKAVIVKARSA